MDLRLRDLKRLNKYIIKHWTSWVDKAPPSWKEDGFLIDHAPIAVTSRFGQNQPICQSANRHAESNDWLEERDYEKISYVNIALATHVGLVLLSI